MEVRFARGEDIPGIIKLLQQVGRVHHEGRPDLFRSDCQKYSPSQVLGMLNIPATPIFVAVEDEQVLGYGFCMIKEYEHDPVIADHRELYIDDLCVDEAHRGQRIGKALYEAESVKCSYKEVYKAVCLCKKEFTECICIYKFGIYTRCSKPLAEQAKGRICDILHRSEV